MSQEEDEWPWPPDTRLFLSSNGNFGLVTPEVQEGDLVCQFLGCEIAVVLRKEGTRFVLVAKALVLRYESYQITRLPMSSKFGEDKESSSVELNMDIETLRRLTWSL
jgi:hypothetical protein